MSKTEWFFLWLLFIGYLFMGASIFYTIERALEEESRAKAEQEQKELKSLLETKFKGVDVDALALKLNHFCPNELTYFLKDENVKELESKPYTWTYYNAFFFALTTISTIGYGNLFPSTDGGRILVIFYSLFGIPFMGIVLSQLGDGFGSVFLRAHHRYKNHVYDSKISLILDILLYLLPGMAVFILAPTFLFQYFEGWSFCTSIYYAFVTLTTIGYGDKVAGQTTDESPGDMAYKIFLLIWIMFGLGYLVMILGFISRAMRSKQINRLEQKLANTFKQTQSKIWNEFVQDVNYIRRALNEAYINKVKPVYRDRPNVLTKRLWSSCPEFSEWPVLMSRDEIEALNENENKKPWDKKRRRAFSESGDGLKYDPIPRVLSDGALGNIDLAATFRDKPRPSLANVDHNTEEFLSSLVNQRKMSIHDSNFDFNEGFNLFSDDEILHSEQSTRGSSNSLKRPKRSRAASYAPYIQNTKNNYDMQKTWSGNESLHNRILIKNMRSRSGDMETGLIEEEPVRSSSLRRLSLAAIAAKNFFTGPEKKKKNSKEKSEPKKLKSHRLSLPDNDFHVPKNDRRVSLFDVLAPSLTPEETRTPMSPVLEQTSLADFLRVMANLKALEEPENRSRHPSLSYLFNPPRRDLLRNERDSSSSLNELNKKDRRFSQSVQKLDNEFRPRASSMSPSIPLQPNRNERYTPPRTSQLSQIQQVPPSVVVTSPDGLHRFSVHNVPSPRNENYLTSRKKGDDFSE